ncbi:MAG: beta-ketoacyl-ACP synthase II [Gemmatimonadaceae bacterium]
MKRRVVVTGMGAVTPVGNDVATTWQSLLNGVSGAQDIKKFDTTNFTVRFACEVKDLDLSLYMDKKDARKMDPYIQFALSASVMAYRDAGLNAENFDPDMAGVVIGSGIGGLKTFEEEHTVFMQRGPSKVSPFFIPWLIADMGAGVVSMRLGLKGPNYATVSACATSAHALGDAMRLVQYGDADIVLAGGTEAAITPIGVAGFATMQAMSRRNDDPKTASRPFDKERDGFVMGEGAATLVLEELEHAKRRGAKILAELVGYGATADAYHFTQPAPEGAGAQKSMKRAMKDAGVDPSQVQYINAHGTSTPFNDANETTAIKAVFGEHAGAVNISSTKSCTGHTLGAAGAIEAVICVKTILEGVIPPTINLTNPDPACDLNYTPNKPVHRDVEVALSNSFGFGGHNVTLAIRRYRE